MNIMKPIITKLYYHNLIRYIIVGGGTFIIDFGLLFFFRIQLHIPLAIATSIGFWVAVLFNFTLNRTWSFSVNETKSLHKHALAYGLLLAFNYSFTVIFVSFMDHALHSLNASKALAISKILAVLIQTSWTYIIYKNYIFTKKEQTDTT